MKATEFEFRYRSLLNLIHFWIAFQMYSVDHINVVRWLVHWNTSRGALLARLIFGSGAVLLALGAAIRTWAAAYLRSDVVHDAKLHTEAIIADGPYRHVRNPLYIGTFLLTVGLGLLASRLGFAILIVGGAIRILRLIGREESELANEQGERFLEFCRRVPRLVPSFHPRVLASGAKPQWAQAFRGEAFMWGFFLTMLAFTITLQDRIAEILSLITLAVWFLQKLSSRRAKKLPA